ncbi:MAG: ABC transporter ATP-binding protein [Opitutales bacterium]
MEAEPPKIEVEGLEMGYDGVLVLRNVNFQVRPGEVKVIMGPSGCGKSTLLRHLIGLERASAGCIRVDDQDFNEATDPETFEGIRRRFGVLFQGGALWSSMTLAENVALPLETYTDLPPHEIAEIVAFKLKLVGLGGLEDRQPSELSGGMRKRAALARAIALDPEIIFFDEPSAGLDPITSQRLDDLILELRSALGATVVVVTHELPSIFAIADSALFLDPESKTALCDGAPKEMAVDSSTPATVRRFLNRGR